MAFIPATWIVEAAMKYILGGQEIRNIIHIDPHESPSTSLLTDAANLVNDWAIAELLPLLSQDLALYEVGTKDLSIETGAVSAAVNVPAEAGQVAADSLPNNVALVVTLPTLLTGRSYRGRFYIPGLPETQISNNTAGLLWAADLVDAFVSLIADLNAVGWDLVITSYFTGGAPRASAVSTIVSNVVLNLITDSQRRRLPQRGS